MPRSVLVVGHRDFLDSDVLPAEMLRTVSGLSGSETSEGNDPA